MDFWLEKGIVEKEHTQRETEVVFVVEGRARARIQDRPCELKENDVILFNPGMLHELLCEPDTIIGRAMFLDYEIVSVLKSENFLFHCNSSEEGSPSCQRLVDIFRALAEDAVFVRHRSEALKYSLLYRLLDALIEDFCAAAGSEELPAMSDDERLQLIFRYVERNYGENIQLSDLAARLFVSPSTISRLFKKQTGSYFKEYIKQVRLRHAVEQLAGTNDSMTKIAMDCGFTSPSVFNHMFREAYGMAPNVYRRQQRCLSEDGMVPGVDGEECGQGRQAQREALLRELASGRLALPGTWRQSAVNLNLNQGGSAVFKRICNDTMNLGAIEHLTRVNLQKHTLYLKEKLGIRYVRVWNIFSKKLELTDGIHTGSYNYDILDSALDFLVSNDLIPFLEFGKRMSVAMEGATKTVYKEEDYIDFHSRAAWEAMFKDFLDHVIRRYGRDAVRWWRFEVAKNRLNGDECQCYLDENYDYFHVYSYVWQTVKAALPSALVGGPMGISQYDLEFLGCFLDRCQDNGCPPDFVSWAMFPYDINSVGEMGRQRTDPPGVFEAQTTEAITRIMVQRMAKPCPIYITEWNCSISSRNYLNDSCYRALYLLRVISVLASKVDVLCVWVASDWISSYYDTVSIANGGNGIVTKNTIPKPICLALEFLGRMGRFWVSGGRNYMATCSENNELYILCFNFADEPLHFPGLAESAVPPEKIVQTFDDSKKLTLNITVEGLEMDGVYLVKRRCVNETEGGILGLWAAFGYERSLSPDDIRYIRESCRPKLTTRRCEAREGRLSLPVEVREQEMVFIHVFHT